MACHIHLASGSPNHLGPPPTPHAGLYGSHPARCQPGAAGSGDRRGHLTRVRFGFRDTLSLNSLQRKSRAALPTFPALPLDANMYSCSRAQS